MTRDLNTTKESPLTTKKKLENLRNSFYQEIKTINNTIKMLKYGFFRRSNDEQKQILKLLKTNHDLLNDCNKDIDIINTKLRQINHQHSRTEQKQMRLAK